MQYQPVSKRFAPSKAAVAGEFEPYANQMVTNAPDGALRVALTFLDKLRRALSGRLLSQRGSVAQMT